MALFYKMHSHWVKVSLQKKHARTVSSNTVAEHGWSGDMLVIRAQEKGLEDVANEEYASFYKLLCNDWKQ